MAKATTAMCRKFLVSQVPSWIFPATSWAYDEGSGYDQLHNNHSDAELEAMTDAEAEVKAAEYQEINRNEVMTALMLESNWKRRHKSNEGSTIVREFMCDTPDNRFDGQVGYRVHEDANGVLTLGEYIGD
jgi:hypothetical protein